MAMLDEKRGFILDRAKGFRPIIYYIPKTSLAYMKACKEAHETICRFMPHGKRKTITNKEMKTLVMRFAVFNEQGRQAMLRDILYETESKRCSLPELLNKWHDMKMSEGLGCKQAKAIGQSKRTLLDFFKSSNMQTTDDFEPYTAHKFIAWRSHKSYGTNKATSASTVKKDLDSLKSLAKLASIHGYIQNGNLWDDAKVKAIAGVNKKIVEPLDIELQTELLNSFKDNPACHDIALLLLITGIRIGELETLNKNSIQNGLLTLHGNSIGNMKTTGKTASAARTLPVCPTLAKLFERGNIFKSTGNGFKIALKRKCKGIHPHRLRHTFAVNKLLAEVPLQMVSYQMGHSDIGITANLYGKFEIKHFKAGHEETIQIRKQHLEWLERAYFNGQ